MYWQKRIKVKAFKLTRDPRMESPKWFEKEIEKGNVDIDESIVDGAARVYGCTIRTPQGKMKARVGDFIVLEPDGAMLVRKQSKFKQLYERETADKNSG